MPARAEDHRRLAAPLLISLFVHGALLSLTFGSGEEGLPGFDWPWRARRAEAPDLRAMLVPQPIAAASASGAASAPEAPAAEWPVPAEPPPDTILEVTLAPAHNDTVAVADDEAVPAMRGATPAKITPADSTTAAPPTELAPTTPTDPTMSAPPPARIAALAPIDEAAAPVLIGLPPPAQTTWSVPPAPELPLPAPSPEPAASAADRAAPAQPESIEPAREQPPVRQVLADPAEADAQREEQRLAEQAQAARREAERQQAAKAEAARQEAARLLAARLEAERQAAAQAAQQEANRLEAARREAQRADAARHEAARQEAVRLEAARQEAVRQDAARQDAARQEAARQEAARAEAARQQAAREESARQQSARDEAARQEASRQETGRQEAARAEAAKRQAEEERREAIKRAIGRQLDEEAARREAAARASSNLPYAINSPRRGRLFGRADANAELVLYAEAWERKIHLNRTFELVRDAVQRPHRSPLVIVALRRDGSVESINFVVSSGVPEVDDAIRRVVESLVPFQPFPPALARDYDVIEIRRTWVFDTAIRLQ